MDYTGKQIRNGATGTVSDNPSYAQPGPDASGGHHGGEVDRRIRGGRPEAGNSGLHHVAAGFRSRRSSDGWRRVDVGMGFGIGGQRGFRGVVR